MNERNVPVLHGEAVPMWRRVVEGVHAEGGRIVTQLWHMGAIRGANAGPHPPAPSMRPFGIWGPPEKALLDPAYLAEVAAPAHPMSESDIADVIASYARSAANAKLAGFDGIAIHGAHGYLIDSFFWSATNTRADRWGGELQHHAGFGAAVVGAIRDAIGQ